jgi:AraC-like DNA-binding protein
MSPWRPVTKRRLRETADPIADIAFEAGLEDFSTFNRRFWRITDMTPGAWYADPRLAVAAESGKIHSG